MIFVFYVSVKMIMLEKKLLLWIHAAKKKKELGSFSTYVDFSQKLKFLIPWYTHLRASNVSFSQNFAYALLCA